MSTDTLAELFDDEVLNDSVLDAAADVGAVTLPPEAAAGVITQESGRDWMMYRGDCCQVIKGMPNNSIDLCVHSPPFSNLYVYSDSEADMGNCQSHEEFIEHYSFLIRELYRVTVPGRLVVVHCKDLPAYLGRDEAAGLIDFPGMIVRAYEECGWKYHSKVTIWKCPVIERARTNSYGLLHNQLSKDSTASRQGMPDYLCVFRKWDGMQPSEFPKPVNNPAGAAAGDGKRWRFEHYEGEEGPIGEFDVRDYSIQVWQRYASPVWFDIDQTDVLNDKGARTERDERHICPLQMGVIRRSVHLWSNPGDVVLSPFAGIGSEGVGALQLGRKFVGIELKDSYFAKACSHLRIEEGKTQQKKLF